MFLTTLEKIVFDNSKGGLFKRYVSKHSETCGGCKDTVSALKCYQNAVKSAYEEASLEGERLMTKGEVTSLLDRLAVEA